MALADSRQGSPRLAGMPGSSRGTLFPERLPELYRLAAQPSAEPLVRWFWISRWSLPDGEVSNQQLIGFPALNLVVEESVVGLSGPTTRTGHRELTGTGWAVAALLRPAAVPAFSTRPGALRDRYETVHAPQLRAAVAKAMSDATEAGRRAATDELASWLVTRAGEVSDEARLANRLADLAEAPELQRVGDLAQRLGVSERTVQRLAHTYIGLSPAALIRRRRLQDAAARIRDDPATDLAALAADLGYADQAHLTNEFARVLGFTPGGYRRSLAQG